jgi:hypothetical protein
MHNKTRPENSGKRKLKHIFLYGKNGKDEHVLFHDNIFFRKL